MSKHTRKLHEVLAKAGIEYRYALSDAYYQDCTSWDMPNGIGVSYMEHHDEFGDTDALAINSSNPKSTIGADYVSELLGLS